MMRRYIRPLRNLTLAIDCPPGVYTVNRYQTELLLDAALAEAFDLAVHENTTSFSSFVAEEICAGCGAAAVALKAAGFGQVFASDIDPIAVDAIAHNAALNGLTLESVTVANVCGCVGSGSEPLPDLLLCNPPCLPDTLIPSDLPRELMHTVDGGKGGVAIFEKALEFAAKRLSDRGRLLVVLTSTMDVSLAHNLLDRVFPENWSAAPGTPVAAPFDREDSERGRAVLAAAESGRMIAWRGPDGYVWRLTWIIVAQRNGAATGERLPLKPVYWPEDYAGTAFTGQMLALQSVLRQQYR